ncbi:MAG: S8 family serine peptidase [Rhizobiaceae bacterium]
MSYSWQPADLDTNLSPYSHWWWNFQRGYQNIFEDERSDKTFLLNHQLNIEKIFNFESFIKDYGTAEEKQEFNNQALKFSSALISETGNSFPNIDVPLLKGTRSKNPHQPKIDSFPESFLEDEDVIIGVIDDGIPFANHRFLSLSGERYSSRIEFLWDQGNRGNYTNNDPVYVEFGKEWTKQELTKLLHEHTDEEAIYKKLGLDQYLNSKFSHGASVMDLAAGFDPAENPHRPIIAVQLPNFLTEDTSGTFMSAYFGYAIDYILQRADRLRTKEGKARPVIINISYGIFASGHNGTSDFEKMLDQKIAARNQYSALSPTTVVLPSGNSFQSKTHARTLAKSSSSQSLTWFIPPDNKAPSIVEIWSDPLDKTQLTQAAIEISLAPPSSNTFYSFTCQEDQSFLQLIKDGYGAIGGVYIDQIETHDSANNFQLRVTLIITRTANNGEIEELLADPGNWKIQIATKENREINFNLWIQRNDTPGMGTSHRRQSYFEDHAYQSTDAFGLPINENLDDPKSYIKTDGTLNAIATGAAPIRVGAYETQAGKPAQVAPYSSSASNVHTNGGSSIDLSAPVGEVSGVRGISTTGNLSSTTVHVAGTSMAAPQVVRKIADQLQQNDDWSASREEVRTWASTFGYGGIDNPDPRRLGQGLILTPDNTNKNTDN